MFYDIRQRTGSLDVVRADNNEINMGSFTLSSAGVRYISKGIGFVTASRYSDDLLKRARNISKMSEKRARIANYHSERFFRKKKKSSSKIALEKGIAESILKNLNDKVITNKTLLIRSMNLEDKYRNSESEEIDISKENAVIYIFINGGKNLQTYYYSHAATDFSEIEKLDYSKICDNLVEKLKMMISAENAPAGKFPVVLDPQLTGVFFHEAVGHACEADAVLDNASILKGKIGKEIASPKINLWDDPRIKSPGGYVFDDEGVRAKGTKLIENGVLKNYMHSRETAARMKSELTGNGRAESPLSLPIPRMSNTYLKKGKESFGEMVKSIKKGIYLVGSRGGVVEPALGNFLFNAMYGYIIRDGELGKVVRDVSLSGNISDILRKVEMVGKKSLLSKRTSYCGKSGQSVPVSEKSPFIKISEAIVGGRSS